MMMPYIPEDKPMTGDEQEVLMEILLTTEGAGSRGRLRVANRIIDAGFQRRIPRKVSRLQLWTYAIETFMLASFAFAVFGKDIPFVFGGLVALTIGSLLTFIGGLTINHQIKTGTLK